jgi:TonB family protein
VSGDTLSCMRPLWALVWLGVAQVPAQAQSEHIYRIGEASAPILLQKNEPEFPIEACKEALQAAYNSLTTTIGTVTLSFVVGSNGRAQNVKVTHPLGFCLHQQAVQAIRTWRFKPALKDGRAVPVYALTDITFRMPGKCFSVPKSAEHPK